MTHADESKHNLLPYVTGFRDWSAPAAEGPLYRSRTKRSAASRRSIVSGLRRPIRGPSIEAGTVVGWSHLTQPSRGRPHSRAARWTRNGGSNSAALGGRDDLRRGLDASDRERQRRAPGERSALVVATLRAARLSVQRPESPRQGLGLRRWLSSRLTALTDPQPTGAFRSDRR